MDKFEERKFLLSVAVWQDSLLQAYRSYHLILQIVLFAIGIGLTALLIATPPVVATWKNWFVGGVGILTSFIWGLQRFAATKMDSIIFNRKLDINYWHKKIIRCELELPCDKRWFTEFKVFQRLRNGHASIGKTGTTQDLGGETELSEEQFAELLEKDTGFSRRSIDDVLFLYLSLIWPVLVFIIAAHLIVSFTSISNVYWRSLSILLVSIWLFVAIYFGGHGIWIRNQTGSRQ